MYQFPNMELLRDLTYQKADEFHSEYILNARDFLEIGLRYVQFAEEEPQLFKFLFQSGRFSGLSLEDLIRAPETAAVVHGYASLIANNAMKYDPDAVRSALIAIAEGLERKDA